MYFLLNTTTILLVLWFLHITVPVQVVTIETITCLRDSTTVRTKHVLP